MNRKNMMNACVMAVRKHCPEILMVTGIAGLVASAVMACAATRKLDAALAEHKTNAENVHRKCSSAAGTGEENNKKKELTKVYVKTGLALMSLYGPSIALGTLSITGILASNQILRKRNMAIAAAYAAIDASFKQYRKNVAQRFGEDADRELRMGAHQEKIAVLEEDENGKKKKGKKSITVVDDPMPSDYARYFCYGEAEGAEQNHDYNAFFLQGQENLANHLLHTHGYLFLNDVYLMLGLKPTVAGQAVGWVYDKNSDDHGDNRIDFGIREVYRKKRDAEGEYEKVFLLDFNVDGCIMNHMLEKDLLVE